MFLHSLLRRKVIALLLSYFLFTLFVTGDSKSMVKNDLLSVHTLLEVESSSNTHHNAESLFDIPTKSEHTGEGVSTQTDEDITPPGKQQSNESPVTSPHPGKRKTTEQNSLKVSPGWNLLSLPSNVTNGRKSLLFPNATSQAYIYDPQTGYRLQDSLTSGIGFWLKFGASETIPLSGKTFLQDSIDVKEGWNMIGTVSQSIAVNSIKTTPTGIIASPFYKFVPGAGYQQTDTLQPGLGYWVKSNQNGKILPEWKGIVYNDSTLLPEELPNFVSVEVDSNQLTLTYTNADDLPHLFPGQVLFGMADSGYTRKVVSYNVIGNQLIVNTVFAKLNEVVDNANIDTTVVFSFPDTAEIRKQFNGPLHYEEIVDGKTYRITSSMPEISLNQVGDLSLTLPNFGIEVTLTSTFQFAVKSSSLTITIPRPRFTCDVQINSAMFDRGKFIVSTTPSFQLSNVTLSASGVLDSTAKVKLLGPFHMGRIISPYVLGMIEFEFTLYAGIQGQVVATGQMQSAGNINVSAPLEAGLEYNGGWSPIWNPNINATMESKFKASGQFNASVKPFIQPSIELVWNRVATIGIFAKPFGYVEVSAPPFLIEAGYGASAGAEAKLQLLFSDEELFNTALTFAEKKWPLWTTKGPDEPKNLIPSDNARITTDTTTLYWSGSHPTQDPLIYDVYLGKENPPQTLVASNLSDTSFFVSNLSAGSTYFWRIDAIEQEGDTTVGPIWKFTTIDSPSTPTLLSPSDDEIILTSSPKLIWNSSIGATSYTLQVSNNLDFSTLTFNQGGLVDTSQNITGLLGATTYYWRVNAMNSIGTSEWSETFSFYTDILLPPEPFIPLSPASGDTGISPVTQFVWTKSTNATEYVLTLYQTSGTDTFSSMWTNWGVDITYGDTMMFAKSALLNSTKYRWYLVAKNTAGSRITQTNHFTTKAGFGTPCPGLPTITYEGKTYNTIKIGEHCWLKENLDVGTMISADSTQRGWGPYTIIEKYCYNDNPLNCNKYGGLYSPLEAMGYPQLQDTLPGKKIRGICPSGWHLPTTTSVSGNRSDEDDLRDIVSRGGNALKEIGEGINAGNGTNISGFSALLGGYHDGSNFLKIGEQGSFLGAQYNSQNQKYMNSFNVYGYNNELIKDAMFTTIAVSVRCVKD